MGLTEKETIYISSAIFRCVRNAIFCLADALTVLCRFVNVSTGNGFYILYFLLDASKLMYSRSYVQP